MPLAPAVRRWYQEFLSRLFRIFNLPLILLLAGKSKRTPVGFSSQHVVSLLGRGSTTGHTKKNFPLAKGDFLTGVDSVF